jgi:hypothetical protein
VISIYISLARLAPCILAFGLVDSSGVGYDLDQLKYEIKFMGLLLTEAFLLI